MRILSSLSPVLALILVQPAFAEATRHMGAHEHGVGQLNIAMEAGQVALEFTAPGADIVGFEYVPERKADLEAVEAAIATLSKPLSLFKLPEAAQCEVKEAYAALRAEEHDHHEGHDEEHHDEDHHKGHDDHAKDHADHEEHADDHAHAHDDHEHDEHDHEAHEGEHEEGHAHDDHEGHEDHHEHDEHEATHSEFHAEYVLSCAQPKALTGITFDYFAQFPNAREVEVQLISDTGAYAFEVEHDAPELDLTGAL